MRSLAPWGILPLLALPLDSWALSLGESETISYLNQPLNAEIALTATPEELQGLRVSLAPIAEYTRQGLEYPAVLRSVEIAVVRNAAGANVIRVTSTQPVRETFLDLIIQVDYRAGTLRREYSLLLDPPTFMPAEVAAEPIAAPVSREPAPQVATGPVVREPAPAPQRPATAPAPAAPAAPGGDYTVQGGDTLWGIAQRNRPADVSINQAMISIYQANPGAFGGNINLLRRGAILRIPPAAQLGSVSAAAATAEVLRQTEAWRAGVQSEPRLVLLPPSEDAGAAPAAASAANNAAELAARDNEIAELEDQLATRDAELAEARRLLEVRSAELAELQSNIASDNNEAVFEDEVAAPESAPTPAVEATPEPVAAAATTPPAAESGDSPLATLIGIVTKPIVWFAGAAILVLLLAAAFLRRRRAGDVGDDEITGRWDALEEDINVSEAQAETTRLRTPAVQDDMIVVESEAGGTGTVEEPFLDLGASDFSDDDDYDGTGTLEIEALDTTAIVIEDEPDEGDIADFGATLSSQTVINLDQADPVAEADFHMAYGLYDHAADLLNQALATDPDNRQLKLKLLEVYFVWGNKDSFVEQARDFRSGMGSGGSADWDKIVIMGKQICPDEDLFDDQAADMTAVSKAIDLDLESGSSDQGLDFTLEDDDDDIIDLDLAAGDSSDSDDSLVETGTLEAAAGDAEDNTLALGAQTLAGLEAAFFIDDDEDADATAESPAVEIGAPADDEPEDPTIEQLAQKGAFDSGATTMETPTIEMPNPGMGDTVEQPYLEADENAAELTAELALDDLGLDVGELDTLSGADELSATGVTRALGAGDFDPAADGTAILDIGDSEVDYTAETEVLEQSVTQFEVEEPAGEDDLDLNLDELSSALGGGDTVEQPVAGRFGGDSGVDLDIGSDVIGDDEPTGTEEFGLDPEHMTEVGTKLDLARAYIDMGDPEGARSILEEVLTEGDAGQRQEAQSLIDALPAA